MVCGMVSTQLCYVLRSVCFYEHTQWSTLTSQSVISRVLINHEQALDLGFVFLYQTIEDQAHIITCLQSE